MKSLLWAAGLTMVACSAQAQYSGEVAYKPVAVAATVPATVSDLLKAPKDDQLVKFSGKIVKKIADEKYIFSDGTAEIRVDIDDELIATVPVDNSTKLTIVGEVDKDGPQDIEIDVKSIKLD